MGDQMIVFDTHILVWWLTDDAKLDRGLREEVLADPSKVIVSAVSIWETLVLVQKGRVQLPLEEPGAALREWIRSSRFIEAPLTGEVAVLSRTLEFEHEDPADRFIAATAFANDARLATSDSRLRALKWLKLAY
ncbi:MAG: type II toxin-antitoxin system VapC family toxin [Fimbriimonadales bacterium]